MAITKGKKTEQKTLHRRKSHSPAGKIRSKRSEVHRLKLRPEAPSRSVRQISEAERPERRGKHSSESWDTQKWLIGKKLAHVVKEKLIADFRKGEPPELTEMARGHQAKRGTRHMRPRKGKR